MKRFLCAALILCLVFCQLPVSVFAANSTYDLDELGMSIDIPSDYVVFMRDIKNNDPNLSIYGLKKDGMYSMMLERNIYLNAWDEDVNYEIIVTMTESPLEDYNQFSDTTLAGLVSASEPEYADMGITFIRSELYQHSQAKFAKIYLSQPNNGKTVYGLEYHTVYNGKAINITMQSYSGVIDSNKEAIIRKIVDTVHFDTAPQYNTPSVHTKAFTYTDKDSGMSFTVPANWVESPMNEDREFIDVKFTSNLEEGLCIIFSSVDMLGDEFTAEAKISTFEKLVISRSAFDNSMLTKTDVAAMWGISEKDISAVTYGEKDYYMAEVMTSGTAYGLTISTPMTYLLRCENGYMYAFQFNGTSSNAYYKDVISLVSSAKYPDVETSETVRNQIIGAYLLLAIIALIFLFLLPILIWRSMKKNKPCKKQTHTDDTKPKDLQIEAQTDYTSEGRITHEPPLKEDVEAHKMLLSAKKSAKNDCHTFFCHRCGNELVRGSLFCNKCGAKIPITEDNE